jgi:hypothetical protein
MEVVMKLWNYMKLRTHVATEKSYDFVEQSTTDFSSPSFDQRSVPKVVLHATFIILQILIPWRALLADTEAIIVLF